MKLSKAINATTADANLHSIAKKPMHPGLCSMFLTSTTASHVVEAASFEAARLVADVAWLLSQIFSLEEAQLSASVMKVKVVSQIAEVIATAESSRVLALPVPVASLRLSCNPWQSLSKQAWTLPHLPTIRHRRWLR